MKNFNILGVHRKIQVLGGGHKKPIYREHCLKRGPWKTCRFTGGLGKKEGVVFLKGGVDTPMHTMEYCNMQKLQKRKFKEWSAQSRR